MSEAELFIYLPAPSSEPSSAVLICPGGGYTGLAINHEGHDMARWYASLGMAAVVLKYRMPHGVHAVPLADAEQAMSVIRSRAAQWNLNPRKVGVVGSSAGGHLAASLSTLAAEANRPDFAILYYPVITFSEGTTHGGSRRNLLGDEQNNRELLERYSLEKQVDAHTPPTLLLLSDDDRTVPPRNSILYYSALQQQGIPASMHIFPTGDHGWGFRTSYLYHDDVKNLIQKWLKKEVDR
jgi:acetyl esterase/lipase